MRRRLRFVKGAERGAAWADRLVQTVVLRLQG
jgi:hypothetical protein